MKKLTIYYILLLVLLFALCGILSQKATDHQVFKYDDYGRIIQEPNSKSGGFITYTYGDDGLLTEKKEYDRNSTLSQIFLYENGILRYCKKYNTDGYIARVHTYDVDGNLLSNKGYNEKGEETGICWIYTYHNNGVLQKEERYYRNLIEKRTEYDDQERLIRKDEFSEGILEKSLRYTYTDRIGWQEDTYLYRDKEVLDASRFYNTNGWNYRTVYYDDGLLTREEFYKPGSYPQLNSYHTYTYDQQGNLHSETRYNGAGYLMEEIYYSGETVTRLIYSFHETQKWLWMKLEGQVRDGVTEIQAVTCYLSSGESLVLSNVSQTTQDDAITWTSEATPEAGITIKCDATGNVRSRKVTGGTVYTASGDILESTAELLAQFNTSTEYPEQ